MTGVSEKQNQIPQRSSIGPANATNNADLSQELDMMHGGPLPLTQDAPSTYGSLPLMSEAMEMQHIQHLSQGIFN